MKQQLSSSYATEFDASQFIRISYFCFEERNRRLSVVQRSYFSVDMSYLQIPRHTTQSLQACAVDFSLSIRSYSNSALVRILLQLISRQRLFRIQPRAPYNCRSRYRKCNRPARYGIHCTPSGASVPGNKGHRRQYTTLHYGNWTVKLRPTLPYASCSTDRNPTVVPQSRPKVRWLYCTTDVVMVGKMRPK